MTLQQLRYLIAIAESGSINAAATRLYTSQSTLSVTVREIERELGFKVFVRSNRGVTLTNEGQELLSYARQVVEQADILEARYFGGAAGKPRLSISTQHYAFSVRAFINLCEACDASAYDFTMREATTGEIIEDVGTFRSSIGILYTDSFNKRVIGKALDDARLEFTPLFDAAVHVFVGEGHPLARCASIDPEQLDEYPRYSFEQGTMNSFYYAEEPFSYLPHSKTIRISDRATLTSLLTDFNGYTISTGVLTPEMQTGIASIPLNVDERMTVGYVLHKERAASELVARYIEELHKVIRANPLVSES